MDGSGTSLMLACMMGDAKRTLEPELRELVLDEDDDELVRDVTVYDESLVVLRISRALSRIGEGNPSHLLLTLGTVEGNFCDEVPGIPTAVILPPFAAACFCCCRAKSSKADVDGSFREKKPSRELCFFRFVSSLLT